MRSKLREEKSPIKNEEKKNHFGAADRVHTEF
jgi:hypothetical protein